MEKIVEAAAKALYKDDGYIGWEKLGDIFKNSYRNKARKILIAALGKSNQPIGYVTKDAISEVAAGRIGNHLFPKGTLHPDNEIPVYSVLHIEN